MVYYPDDRWIAWFDRLSADDYLVIEDFLPLPLYSELKSFFRKLKKNNSFSRAGIGSLGNHHIEMEIRGDLNYWLDRNRDTNLTEFFDLIDETLAMLNCYCFLSLSGFEFQFTIYPPASAYRRHIDRFRERTNRMISLVVYLNDEWAKGDGGELKIYRAASEFVLVEPVGNRVVLFKSADVEHEVLPALKERHSLSGWMLYQPSSLGYLLG